jgi:hypothetical protein
MPRKSAHAAEERVAAPAGAHTVADVIEQRAVNSDERVRDHSRRGVARAGACLLGQQVCQRRRVPLEDLAFTREQRRALRDHRADRPEPLVHLRLVLRE